MTSAKAIAALRKTREIVADHWCKGRLTDDCGNYCVMGALNIAVFGTHNPNRIQLSTLDDRDEPYQLLASNLPGKFEEVAIFNDALLTTHADILKLIDDALADALETEVVPT